MGVEIVEKLIYYQGLIVYGKKRKDWVIQGCNFVLGVCGFESFFLLFVVQFVQIVSVEWFFSDVLLRYYFLFCKSKVVREDVWIKYLGQQKGGFEGVILKWLIDNSDLVIYVVVYICLIQKLIDLVEYLFKVCFEFIDFKDCNGVIFLMVVCRFGCVEIVKFLVEVGVD